MYEHEVWIYAGRRARPEDRIAYDLWIDAQGNELLCDLPAYDIGRPHAALVERQDNGGFKIAGKPKPMPRDEQEAEWFAADKEVQRRVDAAKETAKGRLGVMRKKDTTAFKVRLARAEAGLTLKKLFEKSGVSPVTLSSIERGTRKPRITTLEKIARGLGVPVDELLESRRWNR